MSLAPQSPAGRGRSFASLASSPSTNPSSAARSATAESQPPTLSSDAMAELQELRQQQRQLMAQLQQVVPSGSDPSSNSTRGTVPQPEVSAVAVKLPDFWPADPALRFARAEFMFSSRGITQQRTKFDHVAFALSNEFALEVRDILLSPPTEDPYDTLKAELIRRTQTSEQKRLRQLLTEEELGDQSPSNLLRQMQRLVGDHQLDEGLMRELFMQRMPSNVRLVLAATPHTTSLEEHAAIADRVMEATSHTVSHVSDQQPTIADLTAKVERLSHAIEALTTKVQKLDNQGSRRGRSRSKTPAASRHSSPAPAASASSQSGPCFYHKKFGNDARRCRPPCTFDPKAPASH